MYGIATALGAFAVSLMLGCGCLHLKVQHTSADGLWKFAAKSALANAAAKSPFGASQTAAKNADGSPKTPPKSAYGSSKTTPKNADSSPPPTSKSVDDPPNVAPENGSSPSKPAKDDDDDLDRHSAKEAIPALTQKLMDALPANPAVWTRYLSERAVYVGEDGEITSKKELIDQLTPFPPGFSGRIEVKNTKITDLGDIAISVFDSHETETVYDQHIAVNYRSTHTWRRENGRWRLIAAQAVVLAKDPAPLPIDVGRLRDYVGTYELSGQRRYRVEVRGDTLVGGREGKEPMSLIAVGDNVFADSGSSLGILRVFVRGADGRVVRMVDRRKFADLDWLRVATAPSESKPDTR